MWLKLLECIYQMLEHVRLRWSEHGVTLTVKVACQSVILSTFVVSCSGNANKLCKCPSQDLCQQFSRSSSFWLCKQSWNHCTWDNSNSQVDSTPYRITGKFGEEFNLANWRGIKKNRQIKNRQILIVTRRNSRVTQNLRKSVGIRQI